MGIYRGPGGTGDATQDASSQAVITIQAKDAALAAQAAAETSASNASTSASNASTSATSASSSASSATTSASNASTSATNASSSASSASTSASTATTQAGIATTKASEASTSATNAATSASTATTQATNASNSASSASTSATNASNSATSAATSATNASNSATSASGSATTATTQASNASTSASNAASSASSASTSASTATTQAGIATTQASNASSSASAASTSATNASNSATNAATSATNSASSATSSASSATASAAARDAALAALDSFDDRYLGTKTSDPTLDNDGNALVSGALYFNTTTNSMNVYDGSFWLAAYASLSGALLATNNLSDLNNTATARTNLGLGTAATTASSAYATAAQGTKADSALQPATIGSTVQAWDGDLDAIGAISGTSGLLKKTAANTWSLDTNTYLTSAVTSVTGTSPVVSSGGNTPAISIPAATTSINGYLTSADWTTFNGKQAALVSGTNIKTVNSTSVLGSGDVSVGVTSVTGTAPVVSSGGATPAISMAAANTTTNGYLTSTDWNTFNGKQAAGSYVTVGGALGTPSSGTLTNCTFPTLNQNTTGTAANVTGTVAVANGGTGSTTLTANNVLLGNGTSALQAVAPGTSGNVLTSNGTTWTSATPAGGGFSGATTNAVSSSAITLTSSSTQYQVAQITSLANCIVNLPNATTLTVKGFAPYVIENRNPCGGNLSIKDAGGTVVGYIPVGYIGLVALKDNSTSAGSWTVEKVQPQTFFNWDTASYSTNTQTGTTYYGMVGLTSTLFVRFRYSRTGGASAYTTVVYSQACSISGSTITFGTTVSFNFYAQNGPNYAENIYQFQAIRLSNTAYVLKIGGVNVVGCTRTASNNFRVCTVSGTTITQGSSSNGGLPQTADGANGYAADAASVNGVITRLSDTSFALIYNTACSDTYISPYGYSGSLAAQIVTVSGTTQTVGTAVNLGTSTYSQPTSIVGLSSSSLFVAYGQSASAGATTGRSKMNVVSVSGTTPTWGTSVSIEAADTITYLNTWALVDGAVAPSSSQVIFCTGYNTSEGTVSGTTPTYDSSPYGSAIAPLFLSTSSKAWSPSGKYLNIQTGGFVTTTNAIDLIQINTPYSATAQSPLGAQPTTSFVGANNQYVMLGNTL